MNAGKRRCPDPVFERAQRARQAIAEDGAECAVGTGSLLTDAVVMVEHGGNAIESEAVKAVLLHPPAQVGQQEPQHFPASTHTDTDTHRDTHSRSDKQQAVNYSHSSSCTLGGTD